MRLRQLFTAIINVFGAIFLLTFAYLNMTGPNCYFCRTSAGAKSHIQRVQRRAVRTSTEAQTSLTVMPQSETSDQTQTRVADKFRPEWWRNHTETMCKLLGMNTNQSLLPLGTLDKILVDDKHKLLYCQIAKVASTNMGKIFAILVGLYNGSNPDHIPSSEIHLKYNSLHVHLHSLHLNEALHKINSFYKFMFVRDPFERLLSAFRNKFLKPPSSSFEYLSRKLVRFYRTNNTLNGGVTFEEFVRYLVDPARKVPTNSHWQPFYQLCSPCDVKYDFVGKLQNYNEDTRHVLEVNDLLGVVDFPKMPDTFHSLHKTDLFLAKYYSTVPRQILLELYKAYYPDYAIFNLPVPPVIKLLMGEDNGKNK